MRESFPTAPGGLGSTLKPNEVLSFLSGLRTWIIETRLALDELDTAILTSKRTAEFYQDLTMSLSLWKASNDQQQELLRIWDSGRANTQELANLNKVIWGRLAGFESQAFNLPEAGRLVDLLISQMFTQLGSSQDFVRNSQRIRDLRAALERIRDQVGAQQTLLPIATQEFQQLARLLEQLTAKHARGADIEGELANLEYQSARLERNLIKSSSAAQIIAPYFEPDADASQITAAGQRCPESGCFGTLIDGYCDICGLRADLPTVFISTSATPLPLASKGDQGIMVDKRPSSDGVRCGQPGCLGSIIDEYCDICGARFSTEIKLSQGEIVASQYRICGVLGRGGQGWTYLAQDTHVDNRWVVLKGILNSLDPAARKAAYLERRMLAHMGTHPQIVEIYNFVRHRDAEFIVMQFVPGKSAKQLLQENLDESGHEQPFTPTRAMTLLLEVLPAISHLHQQGLLYVDFKPDNIMVGERVMLIDLGSVREIADSTSSVLATIGFAAPELETIGASIASDIFAIGRTLLSLCVNEAALVDPIIPAASVDPVLQKNAPFYQLLQRCLHENPAERFTSVSELSAQMQLLLQKPQTADVPNVPDIPEVPDVLDVPDVPDISDISGISDISDVLDVPNIPDALDNNHSLSFSNLEASAVPTDDIAEIYSPNQHSSLPTPPSSHLREMSNDG